MSWMTLLPPEGSNALIYEMVDPHPALRERIAYYWVLKCPAGGTVVDELMIPDGFEELIFSFGDAYQREVSRNHSADIVSGSYLVAGKDTGLLCRRIGNLSMVGVKFKPGVLHRYFRFGFDEFFNRTLTLENLNTRPLKQLEAQLFEAKSCALLYQQLDHFFLKLACNPSDPYLDQALHILGTTQGRARVEDILQQSGQHYRTLEKRFRKKLGLSPKKFARNLRFKHVFHALTTTKAKSAFDIHQFGFYDPSHFSREFFHYTGATPAQFLRAEPKVSTQVCAMAYEKFNF